VVMRVPNFAGEGTAQPPTAVGAAVGA
jgi:hypothetical protein